MDPGPAACARIKMNLSVSKELLYGLSDNGPITDFLVNTLAGKESVFSYLIAELCGYTNMNFFYRKFKEMYGMSPKQYRGR